MKQLRLIITGILLSKAAFGQILNFQAGTSFSKINNKGKVKFYEDQYNKTLIGYSAFIGLDYLNKTYFNISSNIGLIRKGGSEYVLNTMTYKNVRYNLKINTISINTTIDFKYPFGQSKNYIPYFGIGPRIDYIIKQTPNEIAHVDYDPLYGNIYTIEKYTKFKELSYGLILSGGFKYNISKYEIGLRYDNYVDFTKLEDSNTNTKTQRTFDINLTFGYKFK